MLSDIMLSIVVPLKPIHNLKKKYIGPRSLMGFTASIHQRWGCLRSWGGKVDP